VERHIKQLEIEREAIKREGDDSKLKELSRELSILGENRNKLRAKWGNEKKIIDEIQKTREAIDDYKSRAESAERSGDYGKVAEIRYGKIKEQEERINSLKSKLLNAQGESALIKEEVEAEDIADVVSKWTGIPVSRMLQSERDKLLTLEEELHKRIVDRMKQFLPLQMR